MVTGPELLRRARREAGLSQEALARRAETVARDVPAYEHGHKSPTPAALTEFQVQVARVFFSLPGAEGVSWVSPATAPCSRRRAYNLRSA